MHRDLQRRRHFTVRPAWEEYSAQHEDAYSYSQFCKLYREWQARHAVTMAQHHKAGEKLFVDYAGSTVAVHAANDPLVKVLVVYDLLSDRMTGRSVKFRGTETHVIPIDAGPSVPAAPTASGHAFQHEKMVRAIWTGRVRLSNGDDPSDAEPTLYRVTVERPDGSRDEIAPAALAELGDNDNDHLFCLGTADPAVSIAFPAGHLVDPTVTRILTRKWQS